MAGNIAKSNDLNLGRGIFLKIVTLLGIIFLISPLIILIIFSFNSSRTVTQWEGFSLHWYRTLFTDSSIWFSIRNTLIIGFVSTLLTTVLGTAAALAIGKYAFRGKKLFENILYVPVILPEIIFGIALLALYVLIRFPLGMASIIVAHITFSLSFVTLIVLARVNNFDRNLEEASLDLGASRWQTFRHVILPNIAPGIISGALFAFTLSIDDFVVTFFTAGVGASTLPLKIYSLIKYGITPAVNAVSTILIICTISVLLLIRTMQKSSGLNKGVKYALAAVSVLLVAFVIFSPAVKSRTEEVNIYNYSDYIDEGVIRDFEIETGIRVNYDYMNDSEELLSRLMMGVSGYDLIFPVGYIVQIMIDKDLLSPLDFSNIPNYQYIDPGYRKLEYDTTATYHIPYTYGFGTIVYNSEIITEEVDSWQIMWDHRFQGKILMLDDIRETFFAAYKVLGLDFNDNPQSLELALAKLIEQKPLLKKYESNNTLEYLVNREVYLGHTWNGSIVKLNREHPEFKMALPREGVLYFVDNFCIPKTAPNKKNAELFINFLIKPENAARNMAKVTYAMPIPAAMEFLDEELRNNPIFLPDPADLPPLELSRDFGAFSGEIDKAWTRLMAD